MPGYVASYSHGDGRAVAVVLLEFADSTSAAVPEFQLLARELGMQIVAMKPTVVDTRDVDQDAWLEELSRLRGSDALPNSSPNQMAWLEAARVRFERDFCLLKQPFIKDDTLTVEERIGQVNAMLSESIKVVRFSLVESREVA